MNTTIFYAISPKENETNTNNPSIIFMFLGIIAILLLVILYFQLKQMVLKPKNAVDAVFKYFGLTQKPFLINSQIINKRTMNNNVWGSIFLIISVIPWVVAFSSFYYDLKSTPKWGIILIIIVLSIYLFVMSFLMWRHIINVKKITGYLVEKKELTLTNILASFWKRLNSAKKNTENQFFHKNGNKKMLKYNNQINKSNSREDVFMIFIINLYENERFMTYENFENFKYLAKKLFINGNLDEGIILTNDSKHKQN